MGQPSSLQKWQKLNKFDCDQYRMKPHGATLVDVWNINTITNKYSTNISLKQSEGTQKGGILTSLYSCTMSDVK